MSDNIGLSVRDCTRKKPVDINVFLTKENAIDLAITLLQCAQKMNIVLQDVECVTDALPGDELYIKNNRSIKEVLKLYQV